MAHELGHNFGAPHDAAAGSECSSVPPDFLMAPELNWSSTFSQCSLNQMQQAVERARGVCIQSLQYADIAVQFPAQPVEVDPTRTSLSRSSSVPSGRRVCQCHAADRSAIATVISLRGARRAAPAAPAAAPCTCQFGDVRPPGKRPFDRLTLSTLGTYIMSGRAAADNDFSRQQLAQRGGWAASAVDVSSHCFGEHLVGLRNGPDRGHGRRTSFRTQAVRGGTLRVSGTLIESISAGAHPARRARAGVRDPVRPGRHSKGTRRGSGACPGGHPGLATRTSSVSSPGDADFSNNHAGAAIQRASPSAKSPPRCPPKTCSPSSVRRTTSCIRSSIGRLPTTETRFTVSNPWSAVESVVPGAGSCPTPGPGLNRCDFGTLDPGECLPLRCGCASIPRPLRVSWASLTTWMACSRKIPRSSRGST